MAYQNIFKRYEIKYLITREQKQRLLAAMEPYMALDKYGRTTIRNLYFDTPDYRLIRHSMEKPVYKEKLRLRSYGRADPDGPVFVELKKKYRSIVYKRRVAMSEKDAMDWLCQGRPCCTDSQISDEINYFLQYYEDLTPKVFLSYQREAYFSRDGSDFRITFDDDILCRREALSLTEDAWGTPILAGDKVLMEIKTTGGIPLWLTRVLTREQIYKTSYSKYAAAYQTMIFKGGHEYADTFQGDL